MDIVGGIILSAVLSVFPLQTLFSTEDWGRELKHKKLGCFI